MHSLKKASNPVVGFFVFGTYDNRLASSIKGTSTVRYTYDQDGNRVTYFAGGATTTTANKNYQVSGATSTKYIYAGSDLVATLEKVGSTVNTYYNHNDQLSGSNVITNASSSMVELLDYYPFGGIRLDEKMGPLNEKKKFTGHEFDSETDLNYMGARYQSGKMGRFMSQDNVFLGIGDSKGIEQLTGKKQNEILADPQSLNSYNYARNNPLANIDKSGNFSVSALLNPINSFTGGALTTLALWGGVAAVGGMNTPFSSARPVSSAMLGHSLLLNPSGINVTEGNQKQYGNVIDAIKNSAKFQQYVSKSLGDYSQDGSINYPGSMVFDKGDLFSSLHKVDVQLRGNQTKDGTWNLNVGVSDTYNYDHNSNYKNNAGFNSLNNAAAVSQRGGVISQYGVNINFGYSTKQDIK